MRFTLLRNHPPTLTGGYPLLFQIFWLRDSQGQIDGILTQKMLNLLLQSALEKKLSNLKFFQKFCDRIKNFIFIFSVLWYT